MQPFFHYIIDLDLNNRNWTVLIFNSENTLNYLIELFHNKISDFTINYQEQNFVKKLPIVDLSIIFNYLIVHPVYIHHLCTYF